MEDKMKQQVTIQPDTDLNDLVNQSIQNDDRDNEPDTNELLEQNRVYPDSDLQPPETLLSVINSDDTKGIVGTAGNFITIIGKAKSRKSFFVSLLTASLISEKPIYNKFAGGLQPDRNKVLLFDTEQAEYHVQCSLNRVLSLANQKDNDNLRVYKLRKFSPAKRLNIIMDAVYNTENIGVVIIDGVRDLITSINSEEQATEITSEFLRWTEELNINLITVLHQNKGDANARGHIGTELMNKSETVLSVTKSSENNNISIVKAEYCRDREPETFAFEIDDNGLPIIATDWEIKTEQKTEKLTASMIPDVKFIEICKDIFSNLPEQDDNDSGFSYSELVIQFKLSFEKIFSKSIGDNKAKDFITYCKNLKILTQKKVKGKYQLNNENIDGL